jgi:hypothetical protein
VDRAAPGGTRRGCRGQVAAHSEIHPCHWRAIRGCRTRPLQADSAGSIPVTRSEAEACVHGVRGPGLFAFLLGAEPPDPALRGLSVRVWGVSRELSLASDLGRAHIGSQVARSHRVSGCTLASGLRLRVRIGSGVTLVLRGLAPARCGDSADPLYAVEGSGGWKLSRAGRRLRDVPSASVLSGACLRISWILGTWCRLRRSCAPAAAPVLVGIRDSRWRPIFLSRRGALGGAARLSGGSVVGRGRC